MQENSEIFSTRNDYQLGRRLFHMISGSLLSTTYLIAEDLTHEKVVHILGLVACIIYLLEQIRISYPEIAIKFSFINKFFLRAEEQLKESAAMPYAFALLLTILTFPKEASLIAIYTLALSDPLSALIGIKFGKHKFIQNKSIPGSSAFFIATFCSSYFVLNYLHENMNVLCIKISLMIALTSTLVEMIPFRLDDNLTIPLYTACIAWLFLWVFGYPLI